jgi:hypothetical protein
MIVGNGDGVAVRVGCREEWWSAYAWLVFEGVAVGDAVWLVWVPRPTSGTG